MVNAKVKLKKQQTIDELQKIIAESSVAIITNYRGVSTAELTGLRGKLRQSSVGYKVVKNTLVKSAAAGAGKDNLTALLDGPIALSWGYGEDVTGPAKLLLEHITKSKSVMTVEGGFLGSRALSAEDVTTLSKLPSKEILVAKVLGGIQAPLYKLVGTLNAPIQGLVTVLNGHLKQLEEAK
ncbi:MAG: 50S ribosomal protein L10 [Dehalogenimonas sp.]|uniref:Large ribosomal subunit protein uL10 n=1 Tax=Candidatus Dehalogenimonas loeffleri TaxID=3127115 RepID=A0ABZ2J5M2_9CHLR|nr:50S ribosomal protein L10 [Dehalogenimonas sp.]